MYECGSVALLAVLVVFKLYKGVIVVFILWLIKLFIVMLMHFYLFTLLIVQ